MLCYAASMAEETAFARWRRQVAITQEQAAEALGVSRSQVVNWEIGRDRATGKAVVPGLAVRSLMTAIAMGQAPQPWPEQ